MMNIQNPNLDGAEGNFYGKTDKGILDDRNVSFGAKGMVAWLMSNKREWNFVMKGTMKFTPQRETAIKSIRDELIKKGYMIQTNFKRGQYRYAVFDSLIYKEEYLKNHSLKITHADGSIDYIGNKGKKSNLRKSEKTKSSKKIVKKSNNLFNAFWSNYPRDNERMDESVYRQSLSLWNDSNLNEIAENILSDIEFRPQLKKVSVLDYLENQRWNEGIFSADKNNSASVNMRGA